MTGHTKQMKNFVEIHIEVLITSNICVARINWQLQYRQISQNDIHQPLDGNNWDIPMMRLLTFSATHTKESNNKKDNMHLLGRRQQHFHLSHMAYHHHLHDHHLHFLLLVLSFILNLRLGSLPNHFLHRPSPFLPDWFHGLTDHLTFILSTAGFVCMVC